MPVPAPADKRFRRAHVRPARRRLLPHVPSRVTVFVCLVIVAGSYAGYRAVRWALASHALLFLTPIFYGVDAVPPLLQNVLMANPLTFVVEQLRLVLFQGLTPNLTALAAYFALACVFAALALWVFRRMRPRFAEMV